MPEEDWSPEYLGNSVYFEPDSFVSIDGSDDRKKLEWKYDDSTAGLSYLNPMFFIDNSDAREKQRKADQVAKATHTRDSIQVLIDTMLKAHPVFANDYASWSAMTNEEREMRDDYYDLTRDLDEAKRDLEEMTGVCYSNYNYALSDKSYSCLVYSASSIADTARAVLTCVDVKSRKFSERWHLDLPAFYYDPNKAEGAGVFEDGDPEFSYRWADVHEGKFVMIAQLQMVCVDMTTGNKLWEIQL